MASQSTAQWNYTIYFHIQGYFFNNFLHQFFEQSAQFERNCRPDIHQQSITILLEENILFIDCLYYLSVHYCCFYIQYYGGIKEMPL